MRFLSHLRHNALSYLALTMALGGTAYAGATLPRNSVGAAELKRDAVRSAEVKDRSLRKKDVAARQLPEGPQGPQGPRGPQGPQGPSGVPATEPFNEVGDADGPPFLSVAQHGTQCPTGSAWTNFGEDYNSAAFYKDPTGVVHLKGVVKAEGTTCVGTVAGDDDIFTLPEGYRPAGHKVFKAGSRHLHGEVRITPAGAVQASDPSEYRDVRLDGIAFRAGS